MKYFNALIVIAILFVMNGCSTLNGNVSLARVGEDNKLYGPWYGFADKEGIVRYNEGNMQNNEDSFSLVFNQAFFKYLPDFANNNEVIIMFKFKEKSVSGESEELVKIIGPMKRIGDKSYSSAISKVMYGPKRTESDIISVTIQIVEFDAEENEENSAFLDFVGSAAETFSLADPVTAGEIRVAKEIAKSIISMNKNDMVFEKSFDLIAFDKNAWDSSSGKNVSSIPLKAGNYALIRCEQKPFFSSYFPLTQVDRNGFYYLEYIFTIPVDLVLLPFQVVYRTFSDQPDIASVKPLQMELVDRDMSSFFFVDSSNDKPIIFNDDSKRLFNGNLEEVSNGNSEENSNKLISSYNSKSWLTFSIEQGRDPSKWELRKELYKSDASLGQLIENPSTKEILEGSKVNEVIQAMIEVKEKAKVIKGREPYSLISLNQYTYASDMSKPVRFVFQRPNGLDRRAEATLRIMEIEDETSRQAVGVIQNISASANNKTLIKSEYEVVPKSEDGLTSLGEGSYQFFIDYVDYDNTKRTSKVPFWVVKKPTLVAQQLRTWAAGDDVKFEISFSAGQLEYIQSIEMETGNKVPLKWYANGKNFSINSDNNKITLEKEGKDEVNVKEIILRMKHGLGDVVFSGS